jgi:hypothetical protein
MVDRKQINNKTKMDPRFAPQPGQNKNKNTLACHVTEKYSTVNSLFDTGPRVKL